MISNMIETIGVALATQPTFFPKLSSLDSMIVGNCREKQTIDHLDYQSTNA